MEELILHPRAALAGEIVLPGSKSISNRALLLAALARGTTELSNVLKSDDTDRMCEALDALGVDLSQKASGEITVTGKAGPISGPSQTLNLGLAGTAFRPLLATLTGGHGTYVLDGTARMRERPVADLVDALTPLGADCVYLQNAGYAPVEVRARGLTGGQTQIAGDVSSQFLTSLLLAAPLAQDAVTIDLSTELTSKPYIDITLNMMSRFGIDVDRPSATRFVVQPGVYQSPGHYLVEGDASSATYFLAAGALSGSGVTVHGIGTASVQGDVAFANVLDAMGAQVSWAEDSVRVTPGRLTGMDVDLNHIPDAAMTIAVLALFAEGTTTIRNISNWRVKETDRLTAMATELRKLGASVTEGADFITVQPPETFQPATIETYGDHRMAMCFSLASLGGVPVTILDPNCVAKTFPHYFDEFERLSA